MLISGFFSKELSSSGLSIDESALSNGESTIVTNKDGLAGKALLVAIVAGTKSEDVGKP